MAVETGTTADVVFATTIASTTESFVNPVAEELAARGRRVQLVAGDRLPQADYPHTSAVIPMHRGMSPGRDLPSLRQWVSHLRTVRPRMIVAGTPKASLLALTAARIAGVPARVYVIHGAVWDSPRGERKRVLEGAERAAIAASTDQLAVSDSLARLVFARGLSRRMPVVLGSGSFSGVDVDQFSPASDAEVRPGLRMCFVGRLNRDKGIDALLRVLDRVREHVDASLTIVGELDTSAPPERATVDRLTSNPYVDWVGPTTDVASYLRQSSLLLLPTEREGLPQVPLEAQACGVPVVSWRVTGVIDAVQDGFTGILVRYGDEVALAQAAVALLENGQARSRMGTNAREWVAERFERRSVVASTAQYLLSCSDTA